MLKILLLLLSLKLLVAEIQDFSILLNPTDLYIHYADGYLRGHGSSIDLSSLTFSSVSAYYDDDAADDDYEGDDDSFNRRRLDGGVEVGATAIDIVAFMLPESCASKRDGCDWTELGVGSRRGDELRWCCTNDAIDKGFCYGDSEYGRLLLNDKFTGIQRSVTVPKDGEMNKQLRNGLFQFDESGRVVVLFANCNTDEGRDVVVSGQAVWKSEDGYLPGELFGFMWFLMAMTIVYVGLFAWFGCLMIKHKESRIPIEKWIFLTIVLGLSELVFRTSDYLAWNADGIRDQWITIASILTGVLKHGVSRCLIVMVALGWGVIRDDLGSTLYSIVSLGCLYIGVAAARDFTIIWAVDDMQTLSYQQETELIDVVTILTFVVAAMDVMYILWILESLNNTMQYLENMSQSRKLQRYLKLRTIFLYSILFATIWAVFSLVNTYNEDSITREEQEWVVNAATEINYMFVLASVAFLWRPNPSAKEYAYVMELTSEENCSELEFKGGVPSAVDDDEEPTTLYNAHSPRD